MTTMVAYHGDRAIKAKYLKRVRAHAKADRLIRGLGWDGKRGCAVGCTLEKYDHSRYPIELGVPVELARVEDVLFERMPEDRAMKWPAQFLSAIPVGADLSAVWPQLAAFILRDIAPSEAGERVAKLFDRRASGEQVARAEWEEARRFAWSERDKAWERYRSAADAAAYAAAYAAAAARAKRKDDEKARAQAYVKMADNLLALMKTAPAGNLRGSSRRGGGR